MWYIVIAGISAGMYKVFRVKLHEVLIYMKTEDTLVRNTAYNTIHNKYYILYTIGILEFLHKRRWHGDIWWRFFICIELAFTSLSPAWRSFLVWDANCDIIFYLSIYYSYSGLVYLLEKKVRHRNVFLFETIKDVVDLITTIRKYLTVEFTEKLLWYFKHVFYPCNCSAFSKWCTFGFTWMIDLTVSDWHAS